MMVRLLLTGIVKTGEREVGEVVQTFHPSTQAGGSL